MREVNRRPIGVFDSGIGGLTVVGELRRCLPQEDIIYLGDTARVPYGNKSEDTIKKFAIQDTEFLIKFQVKVIVVACNTVSSVALEFLKDRNLGIPIFGVVEPGVKVAINKSRSRKVGVIGTVATINSGAHKRLFPEDFEVIEKACPLFVPLAEEGINSGSIAKDVAELYLAHLREKVDTVILGCTHYPILKDVIRDVLGGEISLVDPAEEVAKEVRDFLLKGGLLNSGGGNLDIYLTDIPPHYLELIERFLGDRVNNLKKVDLENH
ncbi:MAG: glutamate racemase [Candidatus Hydrothermae bacterium]|nr:glutamate racemase [Candidatus Hydrothermae bacterium]MDD3649819.1 glutamate racemase [Candidatus Hydrothermia bacterium]